MNNLRKIGLSALAGSLATFSVNAADMSVSGSAAITFSDANREFGSNGNGFTMGDSLNFSASGELDNGMSITLAHEIDGGALDNYPIEYFKTNLGSTFGFFICDKESQTVKIKSLDKFMLNILVAMNRKIEKMVVEKHMKNTIKIECNLCGTDFNLDQNTKINLIESGYESTRVFFDKLIIKSVIDNMINSLH